MPIFPLLFGVLKAIRALTAHPILVASSCGSETVSPPMWKNSQLRETRIRFVWQETGKLALRHAAAEKLGSSGIPLSVSVSPRKLLPWQRAANRGWEEEEAKKRGDGDGGWRKKNRRNKKLPSLVSEQFMWTVCQVARWIPPGHYRFRRRANREMESVPVISAQTHSAWWAQMRVSKASHVWNEEGGGYQN